MKKGTSRRGTFETRQDQSFQRTHIVMLPRMQKRIGQAHDKPQAIYGGHPPVETEVTEHTIQGYLWSRFKKIVWSKVADALPNATIGIRVVVSTAWLHYFVGVSVNNIVRILDFTTKFKITAGGLTPA